MAEIRLFGLGSSRPQALAIALALGVEPCRHEEREFADGEHKARPLVDVEGADAVVVHSLHGEPGQSVNDKLCRLLFFLATLRDHGAARVTAVAPYLCYARKDVRSKRQDPVTTRYLAQLFEAAGADRVLTLDPHNPAAFENAFRCRTGLLRALPLFATRLAPELRGQAVTVLSPDAGGAKRADALRAALAQLLGAEVELGTMEKRRSDEVVSGERLFAEVSGRCVVIVDDMIGSGTTLLRAARAARAAGAQRVLAVASHGLFFGDAGKDLADPALDRILVTDSVPPFRLQGSALAARVELLPAAPLFARALRGLPEASIGDAAD
jgi:ribose-phosphate pyrophosphokinase